MNEEKLPEEDRTFQSNIKEQDPNYRKKLEASYKKCLQELCEPEDDWQDVLLGAKFIIDPQTGRPKTNHIFHLNHPDGIEISDDEVKHSYVFKRSHFYESFNRQKSRLKRDLIECWKNRGYFVKLFKDSSTNKWCLGLYWKYDTM